MSRSLLRLVVTFAIGALLFAQAAPAATLEGAERDQEVPIIVDALLLRPLGFAATVLGAVAFAFPVAPIVALTRPTDLKKPFRVMMVTPATYTFVDPLGNHPAR